jgi:hypothetical protein
MHGLQVLRQGNRLVERMEKRRKETEKKGERMEGEKKRKGKKRGERGTEEVPPLLFAARRRLL